MKTEFQYEDIQKNSLIFKFIAEKSGATEKEPVKVGNVEFWIDNEELIYDIPTSHWEIKLLVADINKMTYLLWDELIVYLRKHGGLNG